MKTQKRVIFLVYQAGIANVFAAPSNALMDFSKRVRLLQSDFHSCELFARGMGQAGERVRTRACNMAGDIALQPWSLDLENQPFSDRFSPVTCG